MLQIIPSSSLDQLIDLINTDSTPANSLTLTDFTVTVGPGKDFSMIQEAIDYFVGKIVSGTCIIEVDAGIYAENLTFASILVMPGATLWLKGDTRTLAGLTYVDHTYGANSEGRTNGGATDAACALANSTTNITVTITGGDPDFDADGWVNGDLLLVYDNAAAITEKTISSTSNKTITLIVTVSTVGGSGSAICLCPNRIISIASGTAIDIQIPGVKVTGFYVKSAAATGLLINLSKVVATLDFGNIAIWKGLVSIYNNGTLTYVVGCISCWGAAQIGLCAFSASKSSIYYITFIKCVTGIYSYHNSTVWTYYSKAVGNTYGYQSLCNDFTDPGYSSAINNTYGYYALLGSFISAQACSARSSGNGTNTLTDGLTGSYVLYS